jgi:hypothetical protein
MPISVKDSNDHYIRKTGEIQAKQMTAVDKKFKSNIGKSKQGCTSQALQ